MELHQVYKKFNQQRFTSKVWIEELKYDYMLQPLNCGVNCRQAMTDTMWIG